MATCSQLAMHAKLAAELGRTLDNAVASPLVADFTELRPGRVPLAQGTTTAREYRGIFQCALAGLVVLCCPGLPDVPHVNGLPALGKAVRVEIPLPVLAHFLALLDRLAVHPQEYHVPDVRQVPLKEVIGPDAVLICHVVVHDHDVCSIRCQRLVISTLTLFNDNEIRFNAKRACDVTADRHSCGGRARGEMFGNLIRHHGMMG